MTVEPRQELRVQARPGVAALSPYVPGRSIDEIRSTYGSDDVARLSLNESAFGPSPRALRAAASALRDAHRYPDGSSRALRTALARRHGLTPQHIVTGNGSDEIIALLALAYLNEGDEAILALPAYGMHRNAVIVAHGTPVFVPLRDHAHDLPAMAAAVTERTRLILLANPHNPTGTAVTEKELREFVDAVPDDILILVDEAYYDFMDDGVRVTARDLLDEHPNVVAARTFSKAYGLSGLRAGYAMAHPEIIATLDRARPPFGLNLVAQEAALAALDDDEFVERVIHQTRAGRERLLEIARRYNLTAIPSQASFVLMRVGDAMALTNALMRRGVVVRPGENLGVPGWIRVSVGTVEEIDRFESALRISLEDADGRREGNDG